MSGLEAGYFWNIHSGGVGGRRHVVTGTTNFLEVVVGSSVGNATSVCV